VIRVVDSGAVDDVVVVAPRSHLTPLAVIMQNCPAVRVVAGGGTRQSSVRRGLLAVPDGADAVLVHDAARCLAPTALIRAVVDAVRAGHPAVVPAVPVTDTIRSLDGGVVDRSRLRAVQTPQGFARDVLVRAHERAASHADDETQAATDDAGLVEGLGVAVHLVPGDPMAFKVTTPLDLMLAEALLASEPS
jgi:2-C-methyl-D-erythritol 4-phosphate cytidylyltransferase